jgi:alkylmercury lyase
LKVHASKPNTASLCEERPVNEPVGNALIEDVRAAGTASALTRTGFNAILDGRAMSRAELIDATGAAAADVQRLIGRALIVDADDRVVGAHGLSLVPARQHRVTLRGRQFWTWCAIDAIGIPAGLGEYAVVDTTCGHCAIEVRLELNGLDFASASHPEARIWEAARQEGRGAAGPPHCALMNLFCSRAHLHAWTEANPNENGRERDLAEVATLGRAEWACLMGASPTCACLESCCDGSDQEATV